MSYQLVSAKARPRGLGAEWVDVDLSATTIGAILSTYVNVWLTLSHPAVAVPLYLDIRTVRDVIAARYHRYTVPQWLSSIDNDSLPTTQLPPSFNLRNVLYSDAWRAGYDIQPTDIHRSHTAELPNSERRDLLMTKEGVDFEVNWRYCMVTVNGFFHRVGGSPDGMHVLEGAHSGRVANDNQVGVHSFREVGQLQYVPITPSMIYKTEASQRMADYAYIQLPEGAENKTVLLVLGGYLHVMDSAYKLIGPRTLRVDFSNLELLARIYDSERYLDLTSLPLTRDPNSPDHYAVSELYSDQFLTAYLCLPQSFIVLVDTDQFFVRRKPVPCAGLPGRYEVPAGSERFPLFGSLGRAYDYAIFPDWGTNVLACHDNQDRNYTFRTTNWRDSQSISGKVDTYRGWEYAEAYFLQMGRYA